MSESSGTNTQTAFAVIAGTAAIIVGFIVVLFYYMRDKGMAREIIEMQRRFDAFKVRLDHGASGKTRVDNQDSGCTQCVCALCALRSPEDRGARTGRRVLA